MRHYTNEEYMEMYKFISFARNYYYCFEELASKGVLPGFHHLGLGAEGTIVGVFSAVGNHTVYSPTVRTQPGFARKFGTRAYLCELLCKKTGFAGGMSGEAHFSDLDKGAAPMSALLGASPSIATGIAMTYKLDKVDKCVVIGMGDGTMNEGLVSEALNITNAFKLPIVWYVENNGIALSTSPKYATGLDSLAERAKGFGLPSKTIDGTNPVLVRSTLEDAMDLAKQGQPQFIEIVNNRWLGHFVGDPDLCRDPDIVLEAKTNRDPVKCYRNFILAKKIATKEELDAIDDAYDKEIHEDVEWALAQPAKTYEDVTRPVYAEEY